MSLKTGDASAKIPYEKLAILRIMKFKACQHCYAYAACCVAIQH